MNESKVMNLEEIPEACRHCEHTQELVFSLMLHELKLLNSKIDDLNKAIKLRIFPVQVDMKNDGK
jgi:hypothetical protein